MADSRPVIDLMNLGPVSEALLHEAEIETEADLRKIGIEETYLRIVMRGHQPSVVLLYALWGALHGVRWDQVPEDVRAALRRVHRQHQPRRPTKSV